MVTLLPITEANIYQCLALKTKEEQKEYVASNAFSLAEAWLFSDFARPFAIYAGEVLVGFLMLEADVKRGSYSVWRLMIDRNYQGKGYGREALRLAIAYLAEQGAKEITLSYAPENTVAERLYQKAGFVHTGEVDGGELVMKRMV